MKIIWSPIGGQQQPTITKSGDALTLDGVAVDFTDLPNGATLPQYVRDAEGSRVLDEQGDSIRPVGSPWIAGDVTRDDSGELAVPIYLPHAPGAPEETRFPVPLENVPDGAVVLPPHDAAPEIEETPTEETSA